MEQKQFKIHKMFEKTPKNYKISKNFIGRFDIWILKIINMNFESI